MEMTIADLLNNVMCVSCVDDIVSHQTTDEKSESNNETNQYFTPYCVEAYIA